MQYIYTLSHIFFSPLYIPQPKNSLHHPPQSHPMISVSDEKPDIFKPKIPKEYKTAQQVLERLTCFDAHKCRACNKGSMQFVRIMPRIRFRSQYLPSLLLTLLFINSSLFFPSQTQTSKPKRHLFCPKCE